MDSESEDIFMQKIEEFICDEDKIVTITWLASKLSISSKDSQLLLEKYVRDQRDLKPNSLAVTYLLSGKLVDDSLGIMVVKEDEIKDKQNLFTGAFLQQIYSVQTCKQVDLNALSLVDYFEIHNPSETPIIGSVKSKNCIKRLIKQKVLPPPPSPQSTTSKAKISFFTKNPIEKVEVKSTDIQESQNCTPKVNNSKEKPKLKSNGIASFFTRGVSKTDLLPKLQEKTTKETCDEVKVEDTKVDIKENIEKLVDSDSGSEAAITTGKNSLKTVENKPRKSVKRQKKNNKKDVPDPKRRKRIISHDSDSDDIFGSGNEVVHEDVIDNSEEEIEVVKPKILGPKNKKRKYVDRTFQSEDGYFVTRKEWIVESPSEEEVEPEIPKQPEMIDIKLKKDTTVVVKSESNNSEEKSKNSKTKGAKAKKAVPSNQKSIMSFFAKK